MAVNKVIYGSDTLIDLTSDTVTAADVAAGRTLHLASGASATGTASYAAAPENNGNADRTNAMLFGSVDSTSTATAFTATVAGLDKLVDGTCIYLRNHVVTSASGFTLNVNGLGAKPCYSNLTNATRDTTIFNVAYSFIFIYDSSLNSGDGGWWIYRGYDSDASLVLLKYNESTWAEFKSAYNANRIVYCLVTYGSGYRLAFMAWYESSKVEFQYYRSVNGHTAAQQSDEVYVYTLTSGNKWTTTVRQTNARVVAGSGLSSTYANNVLTINADGSSYELPPATTSTLGGVKVGNGLSVATDGTLSANEIADGSITTAKLANNAVTMGKIASNSVGFNQLSNGAVQERHLSPELNDNLATKGYVSNQTNYPTLIAADSTTASALGALGYSDVPVLSPADTMMQIIFTNPKIRLCWISGTNMEVAPISFFGNLQTQAVTLYAKGNGSMASGVLGVDESWTITALPTDADGVSY